MVSKEQFIDCDIQQFIGRDVLLLGMRWHYRGILEKIDSQYYWLNKSQMVYDYSSSTIRSDPLGLIAVHKEHVTAVSLTSEAVPDIEHLNQTT